jgi:hypothetical protein
MCPNPFHTTRALLDRIEDPLTGLSKIRETDLLPAEDIEEELVTETPQMKIDKMYESKEKEAKALIKAVGNAVLGQPNC